MSTNIGTCYHLGITGCRATSIAWRLHLAARSLVCLTRRMFSFSRIHFRSNAHCIDCRCGIIFDVIQCLIQRDFSYATQDIRDAYPYIKKALLNPQYDKIVLILHSQGGIEGGLIIDWLLDEMPSDILHQLEVYTFGNAANHFNNPHRTVSKLQEDSTTDSEPAREQDRKSIGYIEHYANSKDFVSVWGVLNFVHIPNRYMGRLFVRPGSGHLMNQHYLDNMFPFGPDWKVLDSNEFMDMPAEIDARGAVQAGEREGVDECIMSSSGETSRRENAVSGNRGLLKVRDFSRLWLYRNGGSPDA